MAVVGSAVALRAVARSWSARAPPRMVLVRRLSAILIELHSCDRSPRRARPGSHTADKWSPLTSDRSFKILPIMSYGTIRGGKMLLSGKGWKVNRFLGDVDFKVRLVSEKTEIVISAKEWQKSWI